MTTENTTTEFTGYKKIGIENLDNLGKYSCGNSYTFHFPNQATEFQLMEMIRQSLKEQGLVVRATSTMQYQNHIPSLYDLVENATDLDELNELSNEPEEFGIDVVLIHGIEQLANHGKKFTTKQLDCIKEDFSNEVYCTLTAGCFIIYIQRYEIFKNGEVGIKSTIENGKDFILEQRNQYVHFSRLHINDDKTISLVETPYKK